MKMSRGIAGLIAASLVVAIAIFASGQVARTVNGIGGLLWIGSAVVIIRSLRATLHFGRTLLLTATLTTVLVLVTRPSDYVSAALGFVIGGAFIAAIGHGHALSWAAAVPALWLPVHLAVALSRALDRAIRDLPAHVRTEPPPTSAFVPCVMVIAALIGGIAVGYLRDRAASHRAVMQSS